MAKDGAPRKPQELPPHIPVGGPGTLPFRSGQAAVYTDSEKEALGHLGWKPGDPLPPELAEKIALARREARDDLAKVYSPVPPGTPPTRVPPEIDISKLPPEHQRELRQLLRNFNAQVARQQQEEELMVPNAPPGVNEAILQHATLEDDLTEQVFVPGLEAAGPLPVRRTPSPAAAPPPPAAAPTPPADPSPPASEADKAQAQFKAQLAAVVLSDADLQAARLAFQTGDRFRKSYPLAPGMRIGFRDLTVVEAEFIVRTAMAETALENPQAARDLQLSMILSTVRGDIYRVILAIDYLEVEGQGRTDIVTWDEYRKAYPKAQPAQYRQAVQAKVMPSEMMRNRVLKRYGEFYLTKAKLDEAFEDPNV